jgi:hypothetical protein
MRLFMPIVAVCIIGAPALAREWTRFESKTGKYSIMAPGKLRESKLTIATDAGPLTVTSESISESSKLLLSVSITDYPPRFALVDAGRFLDAVRDGLKAKEGKILRDEVSESGREVLILQGKYATRTRLVLDGTRLYQITATGPQDQVESKLAGQFLQSFAIAK